MGHSKSKIKKSDNYELTKQEIQDITNIVELLPEIQAEGADKNTKRMAENVSYQYSQIFQTYELRKGLSDYEYFSRWTPTNICNSAYISLHCPDEKVKNYSATELRLYKEWWRETGRRNINDILRIKMLIYSEKE